RPRRNRCAVSCKNRSPRHGRLDRAERAPPPGRSRHCRGRSTAGPRAGSRRSSRRAHARARRNRGGADSCWRLCAESGGAGVARARGPARDELSMSEAPRVNLVEFTVSELAAALKRTVEDAYAYVRVRGEISGFKGRHASGHCYFALKDEGAKIEAVIWKSAF